MSNATGYEGDSLTPKQEEMILQLAEWAEAHDAGKGITHLHLPRGERSGQSMCRAIEKALGWGDQYASWIIRTLADHPEVGYTALMTRGPNPTFYFSDTKDVLENPVKLEEAGQVMRRENLFRMIRSAVKVGKAYRHLTTRRGGEADLLKAERNAYRAMLVNMQASLGTAHEDIQQVIERALVVLG